MILCHLKTAAAIVLAVSLPSVVSNAREKAANASHGANSAVSWPVTRPVDDSRQELEQIFASPGDVPTGVYW